tara:strand:+ start:2722 stop:3333 length:612 start_codon:yes stop_codon:yes gene_type:complete
MKIRIRDLDVAYLTSEKYPERDAATKLLLESSKLDFKRCDGGITNPYTIGVAKGHLQALESLSLPCLLLEDDVNILNGSSIDIDQEFEVPDDADALYLGVSIYGRLEGRTIPYGIVATTTPNPEVNTVYNMLSMHAIVYLSERYRNHIKNLLNKHIEQPVGGVDDPIAETMSEYNVYAVTDPIFYQADGHSEQATMNRIPLKI